MGFKGTGVFEERMHRGLGFVVNLNSRSRRSFVVVAPGSVIDPNRFLCHLSHCH